MSNRIKNKDLNFPNLHAHLLLGVKSSSVFRTSQNSREKTHSNNNNNINRSDCQSILSTYYASCPMLTNLPAVSASNPCKTSLRWASPSPSLYRWEQKSTEWLRVLSMIIQASTVKVGFQLIKPDFRVTPWWPGLCVKKSCKFPKQEKWAHAWPLTVTLNKLKLFHPSGLGTSKSWKYFSISTFLLTKTYP